MSVMETVLTISPIGIQCTLFGAGCPHINLLVGILVAVLFVSVGAFGTLNVCRLTIGRRTRSAPSRLARDGAGS